MRAKALLVLACLSLCAAVPAAERAAGNIDVVVPAEQGSASERARAIRAAESFVAAGDRNRIEDVWPTASVLLRATGDASDWTTMFELLHRDIGRVKGRRLVRLGFTDRLADKLAGRFCILQFEGDYERATVDEKVVVSFEDGTWKPAGYLFDFRRKS